MYNCSGIIFRMIVDSSIWIILGLICILIDCKNAKRAGKVSILSLGLVVLGICTCCHFGYKAMNPTIEIHEGYLSREYRSGGLATTAYVFTAQNGKKPTYYLDSFSRQEIFPDGLQEDIKYRVYYEADTHIILAVEECT